MAARTSSQTGNWGDTSTWGGDAAPGIGDTFTIASGHTVTLTANVTVGTSPGTASTVATISGTLVVGGYSLDVRGDILYAAGQITVGAGGRLRLDNVPDGVTYRHLIGSANNQTTSRLEVTGSSGSPATLDYSPAGTTGTGSISANGVIGGGHARVQYATVTLSAIYFYPYSSTAWDYYWKNCTFTGSAGPSYVTGFMGANSRWNILDNVFTGTTSTYCLSVHCYNAMTGGQRNILRNDFDKAVTWQPRDCTIEDNIFRDSFVVLASYNGDWASFARNIIVHDHQTPDSFYGSMTDPYVVGTYTSTNEHVFIGISSLGDSTHDGVIFDLDSGDQSGDMYSPTTSSTTARTRTVIRNLMLPTRTNGYSPGILCSFSNPASGMVNVIDHNTVFTDSSGGEGGAVARVGETQVTYAGLISSVRSNLVWGSADSAVVKQATAGNVADATITVADYNCGYDTTGDAAFTDSYVPPDAKFGSAPGGNDVNVDPQFLDTTRNILTWDTAQGSGTGTVTAALNYIRADIVTRIAALTAWVRAGYEPGNASLQDAGHDGVTIGAVEYSAPAAGGGIIQLAMHHYQTMRA